MKTIMLIALMACSIFFSGFTSRPKAASGAINSLEKSFNIRLIKIPNTQTVSVVFEKPIDKSLRVKLIDPYGEEIVCLYVNMKSTMIYQNFNFTDAELGEYKLEISDRRTRIVKKIRLETIREADVILTTN